MRRIFLVFAFFTALCGVVALIVWMRPRIPAPPPGATIDNFRRLRIGMRLEEATEVFGRKCDFKESWKPGETAAYWYTPVVSFQIYVDDSSGRLTGGETIWSNVFGHQPEFVIDDSWEAQWHRFWFGEQRVLE
jgi:hypothetical protein